MQRLCGRPGCSDAASVTYGMRPEDLVFWIDALPDPLDERVAVLCRRHADSMVVPRGWTLDDLRDPDLHLFRPPLPAPTPRQRAPRQRRESTTVEQLQFDAPPGPDDDPPTATRAIEDAEPDADVDADADVGVDAEAGPWTPLFDEADDLDGLLDARSPLLSRAFRTADRPAE